MQYVTLDDITKKYGEKLVSALLLKTSWQKHYRIVFLYKKINSLKETIPQAISDMLDMRKNNAPKYERLLESIKLQLEQKEVVRNQNRIKRGDPQQFIYEFRSSAGAGLRLFFFFEGDMVVCTHGWIKDKFAPKIQDREFRKADTQRISYLKSCKKNK